MRISDLSCSEQDYLDSIYQLNKQTGCVYPVDIANDLHVTKPSVTRAIRILTSKGMIYKNSQGEIIFTSRGIIIAESLSNTYQTVKEFFNKTIGENCKFSKEDVIRISYSISEESIEAIQTYLRKGDFISYSS